MANDGYKRKLEELEQQAAELGKSGWLTVTDRAPGGEIDALHYYDNAGRQYTRRELEELDAQLEGIIVIHWGELPPGPPGYDDNVIRLSWGDLE